MYPKIALGRSHSVQRSPSRLAGHHRPYCFEELQAGFREQLRDYPLTLRCSLTQNERVEHNRFLNHELSFDRQQLDEQFQRDFNKLTREQRAILCKQPSVLWSARSRTSERRRSSSSCSERSLFADQCSRRHRQNVLCCTSSLQWLTAEEARLLWHVPPLALRQSCCRLATRCTRSLVSRCTLFGPDSTIHALNSHQCINAGQNDCHRRRVQSELRCAGVC